MALIEVSEVTKFFKMGTEVLHALDGVSFSIKEGEYIAFTGPSGSGKSTLMNILGLLDAPHSGTYTLDGKPTLSLDDDARALLRNQKIGFVFQTFNLLPRMSALRNVEMPLVYSASYNQMFSPVKMKEMATEALRRVHLSDRMTHKPNELSGGQRQRVAIARALVNQPKIVFADEPTGNLDSKTGQEILTLFEELNRQGVTLVIVTHDPEVARRAGRVIAMSDGKIARDERMPQHSVTKG